MAPSSHTAAQGVTWGRPSARTVEIQNTWADSSTRRVSSHSVATAPGALYRSSRVVTGVVNGEPHSDRPLKTRLLARRNLHYLDGRARLRCQPGKRQPEVAVLVGPEPHSLQARCRELGPQSVGAELRG